MVRAVAALLEPPFLEGVDLLQRGSLQGPYSSGTSVPANSPLLLQLRWNRICRFGFGRPSLTRSSKDPGGTETQRGF